MKFFCVVAMLFFSYANLFAQSLLEQRIDFSTKNKSLESTLYKLIDKKGINISFNPQILPKEQLVTIHAKNERIENILIQLFENSPLTYKVIGNQIVLYEKFIPLPVKKHTVSGYIEDESSGERLIGANVFEQNTSKGTSSNHFGFYSLTLEGGKAQIHFSYLGYESDIVDLDIGSDQILNISLKTALTLQEIIVTDADTAFREFRPVNVDQLSNSKIENTQRIGGESDIIRTTHFLPGVQTGTDGVGGIHVRGGGVGQNLVMIDDVPVYNISHGAGVFSIFNTSAIKSAQLYKGGFPARFGGRLSSVLEIRMKEGNKKKLSGKAELGMLTAKAMLEGPFKKDKSSFFVSFRQSLVNSYIVPLSENFKAERGEEGAMRYNFYDINAKLNHSFSQKDKIYFSLYKGRDDFTNNGSTEEDLVFSTPSSVELNYKLDQEYKEQFNWGNNISSFRWNHLFNNKLFSNTTLIYSKLDVGINYSSVDSLLRFVRVDQIFTDSQTVYKNIDLSRYRSSIEDKGVKIDFDYYPNAKHYLKFGTAYTRHTFLPGALSSDENSELFGEDQFFLRE
ncbi:MAG: TonB-dependent receptor plug domain-containing protein, partial [Bacteroidetes bacterium]|nr:TonB-dependent receptor plug domain-containing protein [Bacteroidota bacterium]